jgi:hypothetical protein
MRRFKHFDRERNRRINRVAIEPDIGIIAVKAFDAEPVDETTRCRITDGIDACQSVCGAAGDTGG